MFKNLPIGKKLAAAFALVLALGIGVGTYSIDQLRHVYGCSVDLSTNWMPSLQTLASMRGRERANRTLELTALADPARAVALRAAIAASEDKYALDDTAYRAMISSPAEKAIYESFDHGHDAYVVIRDKALDALQHGHVDEARTQMLTAGATAMAEFDKGVDADVALNTTGGDDSAADATHVYRSARVWIVSLLVTATTLGSVTAWLIARMIARPVARAVTVLEAVAKGDLEQRLDATSTDEVGRLAAAMNTTVVALRVGREVAKDTAALMHVKADVGQAKTADDAVRAALESVRTTFGWAYGSFWKLDAAAGVLRFGQESGSVNADFRRATIEAEFREGTGLAGRAWKARDLVFAPTWAP